MPWKRVSPMDQRIDLIRDWIGGNYSKSELARSYGVSRPTLDKWLKRYLETGESGLQELSRRPLISPSQTAPELLERLVEEKLRHLDWGPKKLVVRLRQLHPELPWPAPSTAGEWLKREGLVQPRRRARKTPENAVPLRDGTHPNQLWCADFKGHFRTQDQRWCYPLTLTDQASRYLLCCRGLPKPTGELSQRWFEWAFREYGLPETIRTDNGSPFASVGPGGLSRLSVWFIRLGIHPERIAPGRPDQNGRHERMHKSLKAGALKPPAANLTEQQRAFERFRREFNEIRPHESLNMEAPAQHYSASTRPFPSRLPAIEYPTGLQIRRVRSNGCIKWKGGTVFLSEALIGEWIALREIDTDRWDVCFSHYSLGRLGPGDSQIQRP